MHSIRNTHFLGVHNFLNNTVAKISFQVWYGLESFKSFDVVALTCNAQLANNFIQVRICY